MNMTSACFINLMTNNIFPEPDGPPTIHVNGCFQFITSSQCVLVHVVIVYDAILRL